MKLVIFSFDCGGGICKGCRLIRARKNLRFQQWTALTASSVFNVFVAFYEATTAEKSAIPLLCIRFKPDLENHTDMGIISSRECIRAGLFNRQKVLAANELIGIKSEKDVYTTSWLWGELGDYEVE